MTPFEAADYFTIMWQQYTHNQDEPPDWETPDDLDGQPEQPWYEDLADWIIQGFLAVTFTPEAAIVYQATVPKLRVAIRTGNLGALFRVLINGVEVWTGDSYDAITDLLEHTFDMSAETEPYTVRIEHAGIGEGHGLTEAKLEVVRGEAVASMVATILRADPEGCGIQWSTDDGGTWDTIDLSTCINTIANGAIGQAIDDGLLQRPGTQPPPAPAPDPGDCSSWHVSLQPGAKWLCPSPVSYGDQITVSNAVGGWSIGELEWWCPDGKQYYLGLCTPDSQEHLESDILNPDAYHMELIGQIEGTSFPVLAAAHNVIETVVENPFYLMANTGLTGVPSGSIEFDVELCRNAAGWTHTWDVDHDDLNGADFSFIFGTSGNWDGEKWTPNDTAYFCLNLPEIGGTYISLFSYHAFRDPYGDSVNRLFSGTNGTGDVLNNDYSGAALHPDNYQGGGSYVVTFNSGDIHVIIVEGTGTDPWI